MFLSVSVRKHGGLKSVFLDSNSPSLVKTTQNYRQIARLSFVLTKNRKNRTSILKRHALQPQRMCKIYEIARLSLNDTKLNKTTQNGTQQRPPASSFVHNLQDRTSILQRYKMTPNGTKRHNTAQNDGLQPRRLC